MVQPAQLKKIAVFASGTGTNALEIIRHFSGHDSARVRLVLCNRPGAGVIQHALNHDIPLTLFKRRELATTILDDLVRSQIDFIVLAGFLLKIPESVVEAFPDKIINIHPALLPKYGGKGMYGQRVHEAVIAAGDKESGITIHLVNEFYDEGEPVFQATCPVTPDDTPKSLARKVQQLEHQHYPKIIEQLLS